MPLINQVPLSFYRGWKSFKITLTEEEKDVLLIAAVALGIVLVIMYLSGYTDLEGIDAL